MITKKVQSQSVPLPYTLTMGASFGDCEIEWVASSLRKALVLQELVVSPLGVATKFKITSTLTGSSMKRT